MNKQIKKTPNYDKGLVFVPLGGSDEIGMNLNLYGYDNQWIMVDLGISFNTDVGVEVIMPDPAFIVERKKNLLGIVLTHAHEDHIGAVPYLWNLLGVPIYASPFTAELVRRKLKEVGLLSKAKVIEVPLGSSLSIGPFGIEYVTITHSIPEPNVLAITTPEGLIVHTGDWKIDPDPQLGQPTDIKRLKELGDQGVLAMVCDSTNVFTEGHTGSEKMVYENLKELIGSIPTGRLAVGCFATNVARVQTVALAALAAGRKVCLVGHSLRRMDEVARSLGYMEEVPPFVTDQEAMKMPRDRILFLCTGSQGEPRAALTRISNQEHPSVRFDEGDTVIYSSRMIPGNEKAISKVQNTFTRHGVRVITDKKESIHVSGHPSRDELKLMYEWIRPHIAIPVHGEARHLMAHRDLALECGAKHAFFADNGIVISLTKDDPKILDQFHVEKLARDGTAIVPFNSEHLRERGRLKNNGAMFITVTVDKSGRPKYQPTIALMGVETKQKEDILQGMLQKAILNVFKSGKPPKDVPDLQDKIRMAARKVVFELKDKKPQTVVHVVVA